MEPIGPEAQLLTRLLSAAELRMRVLSSNLANSNTPGYKRQTVEFESLLREAMGRGAPDLGAVVPRVRTDVETPCRPDGNNVTLEAELNAIRENRLLYETYAAMLSGQFSLLDLAIRGRG
ncbi:MAG: flagellar basal body rod protein FlgB [Planctomycetota bacterium]